MNRDLRVAALAALVAALTIGALQTLFSARADQSERVPPTAGIYTGVQFSQLIGDSVRSISTGNKGSSAPANVGGSAVDGLEWIDDSVTPWIKKRYVNGGWAVEGALDPADSSYAGVIGGGLGSIASASTTDLGSVPQANVSITGTTAITSFGSSAPSGVVKILRFADVLKLTHSSGLTVPGGYDLVTAAGDRAIVTHLGSGNWEITQYTRANGVPVDISAVGKPTFDFSVSMSPLHVAGYGQALSRSSYPAYLAKVTRAQNGTRASGNATITGIADTSGMGAGMPVEGTGINSGCTIASVVADTSITLNSSSCVTSSGTSTVTVFFTGYGSGGSASTVGVPDCRGRTFAGRDRSDPGSLANRLTTTYFGADSAIFNVAGDSRESTTLTLAQLPTGITSNGANSIAVNYGGSIPVGASPFSAVPINNAGGGNVPNGLFSNSTGSAATINSIAVTSNNTSGNPHRTVQPTLIAECTVRVTP